MLFNRPERRFKQARDRARPGILCRADAPVLPIPRAGSTCKASVPFRVRPLARSTKKRPAEASRFNMLWWAVRGSACCAGSRCGASRLARCAGKCLRISSAPRPFGFDPMRGQQKSDQPKPVALTCFGGPSGGRTLDRGIKSLERDVLARAVSAYLQVPMFLPAPYALKLHWGTVINGY